MGILYHIFKSLQELEEKKADLTNNCYYNNFNEKLEDPPSLIELLSQPIGKKEPIDKSK